MEQSPFRIERRLTPELFDHYVAKARAERAKAIAAFFGQFADWLRAIAAWMVRHRRPARSSIPAARRLMGVTMAGRRTPIH